MLCKPSQPEWDGRVCGQQFAARVRVGVRVKPSASLKMGSLSRFAPEFFNIACLDKFHSCTGLSTQVVMVIW